MVQRGPPLPLQDFTAKLDRSTKLFDTQMAKVLQRVAFDAAENIIVGGPYADGTPVDTGFARASWYVSLNDLSGKASEGAAGSKVTHDKSGRSTMQMGFHAVGAAKIGDTIWILNNVPYIINLEYGSSKQAPYGMVRLVLSAGQMILDQAVKVELR